MRTAEILNIKIITGISKYDNYFHIRYTILDNLFESYIDIDHNTSEDEFINALKQKNVNFTSESYLQLCRYFNWNEEYLILKGA
jgi:hypothetical protein